MTTTATGIISISGMYSSDRRRQPDDFYCGINGSTVELIDKSTDQLFYSGPASEWTTPSGTATQVVEGIEAIQAGALKTRDPYPELDVSTGLKSGYSSVFKWGSNEAVSSSTVWEDLILPGGLYPFPTAADNIRVRAGGNAADDAAGANARTITVEGLDTNFNAITENITLAGSSASSNTTQQFRRITRAYVATSGTYGALNAGPIIIEDTGGNELARIGADAADTPAGYGRSRHGILTVANGFDFYLKKITITVGDNKTCDVRIAWRPNADITSAPFSGVYTLPLVEDFKGSVNIPFDYSFKWEQKTDIWIQAKLHSGSGTSTVSSQGYGILVAR